MADVVSRTGRPPLVPAVSGVVQPLPDAGRAPRRRLALAIRTALLALPLAAALSGPTAA